MFIDLLVGCLLSWFRLALIWIVLFCLRLVWFAGGLRLNVFRVICCSVCYCLCCLELADFWLISVFCVWVYLYIWAMFASGRIVFCLHGWLVCLVVVLFVVILFVMLVGIMIVVGVSCVSHLSWLLYFCFCFGYWLLFVGW